uniref:uncharacterized protein LOC122604338 n=1 Tax=Erigeron canadensis TaxID=72917 RepID=UPI001CB90688|nr:uncharacterized protein LOC122604338 [Erigeron canadensis]
MDSTSSFSSFCDLPEIEESSTGSTFEFFKQVYAKLEDTGTSSNEFLHRPTSHDVALITQAHEERHRIPGMLVSLDCTHVEWRLCPKNLKGQYTRGDHKQSPLFQNKRNGSALDSSFIANGWHSKRSDYLTDGIYPRWDAFVNAYPHPVEQDERKLKILQEAARKDVERTFGVLKEKWKILDRSLRLWTEEKIGKVVATYIILHNMIIKDNGRTISPVHIMDSPVPRVYNPEANRELQDENVHHRLRYDLTAHISALDYHTLMIQ